ncbi:MAG TPA: dihydrofolate reductase family protein [Solirubrobacteraceae bacterium]|nr:dihydrofolate reductase family protein [Solirubrobacteraceae bacterium]
MERFTRLLPDREADLTVADVAAAVPGPPPDGRPFLLVNMIATADGRATIAGRTGPIANRADYELFHALRTRVDGVMVGAETVRVEGYGAMEPPAVLVTRSARVPAGVGLLKAPGNRVVVLTPSPDAELPPCEAQVSYLRAPLEEGVPRLRAELGMASVLCEGGPQLLGDLLRAGLVDELHLVLAPKLAAGPDPVTIVAGPGLDPPAELEIVSLHESGGYLFFRYAVR